VSSRLLLLDEKSVAVWIENSAVVHLEPGNIEFDAVETGSI
jgi:hypothetical protein